jgi:hypothetical protein
MELMEAYGLMGTYGLMGANWSKQELMGSKKIE